MWLSLSRNQCSVSMVWYVTSSSAINTRSPGNCLSVALFSSQMYWLCDCFDKLNDWQLQFRRQYKAHVKSSRTVVWVISCPVSLKLACLVKLASASEKSGKNCHHANSYKRTNNSKSQLITFSCRADKLSELSELSAHQNFFKLT